MYSKVACLNDACWTANAGQRLSTLGKNHTTWDRSQFLKWITLLFAFKSTSIDLYVSTRILLRIFLTTSHSFYIDFLKWMKSFSSSQDKMGVLLPTCGKITFAKKKIPAFCNWWTCFATTTNYDGYRWPLGRRLEYGFRPLVGIRNVIPRGFLSWLGATRDDIPDPHSWSKPIPWAFGPGVTYIPTSLKLGRINYHFFLCFLSLFYENCLTNQFIKIFGSCFLLSLSKSWVLKV